MISISELDFRYPSGRYVFQDLNLSLESGKIYGLLGRNGAGKTTLIKNILGLRRPQEGRLLVNGFDPSYRQKEFLQSYFFVSEDPFIPEVSIKEYIDRYAYFYPLFKVEKFFQLLNEFDLPRNLHLKNISFGQKKKALLAFAIATNTSILVMDEPTNGLDIPSKKQFRKIISHLAQEERLFIISTHQIRDLHSLIDHVLLLDQGKLILDNDMFEISDKLSFEVFRSEPEDGKILFYERVPGGYLAIKQDSSNNSLEVDLEVLFNAVIDNQKVFTDILKSNCHAH